MKNLLILSIILFFFGCATTTSINLYENSISYPATDPNKVKVFQKKPDRKFMEIGEITVDGASEWEQAERIFKIKGAEFGADAVYVYKIINHTGNYSGPALPHFYYGLKYHHGFLWFSGTRYYHRYYYHYGYNGLRSWMTVIGIMIKYSENG